MPRAPRLRLNEVEMQPQVADQRNGKGCEAVLPSLAVSYSQLTPLEVHVFDAESHTLQQAQTRAVEQGPDQARATRQLDQNLRYLSGREHDWNAFRSSCAHQRELLFQRDREHVPVQKQECRKRLILSGGAHGRTAAIGHWQFRASWSAWEPDGSWR